MRILFVCQSADPTDPVIADTVARIDYFSKHPAVQSIKVLTVRGNGGTLHSGVQVHSLGTQKGRHRMSTLIEFWKELYGAVRAGKCDVVYFYMTPTLLLVAWPIKILTGVRVVIWFSHSIYTLPVRFALKYCADLWFNVNASMTNFSTRSMRLVGQGVDTKTFRPHSEVAKIYDLVTVGRITPVKRIDLMLNALAAVKQRTGKAYSLAIAGDPYSPEDHAHKQELMQLAKTLGVESQVSFLGAVAHEDLPRVLCKARAFLFTVEGGVGKATLEAMGCGLPMIISSPKASDFFGPQLSPWFLCEPTVEGVSAAIHRVLSASHAEVISMQTLMLEKIKSGASMEMLIDRIVTSMQTELGV